MATTKAETQMFDNEAVAAGGADETATIDLSAGYGGHLNLRVDTGGTGPTVPGEINVETSSESAGEWFHWLGPFVGSTSANTDTDWSIEVPPGIRHLRVRIGSNTGFQVNFFAYFSHITAVS